MFVTYKPEDSDPQVWEFNPQRVRASAAELVERRYGKQWEMFLKDLMQGSMQARRVLLWHLICRTHQTLRFEDTPDFYADELLLEFSRAELLEMRAAVESNKGLGDEERAVMLSALDDEIEQAPGGVDEGKALSRSDSAATG